MITLYTIVLLPDTIVNSVMFEVTFCDKFSSYQEREQSGDISV